jgi:hypothetical protein
MCEHPDILFYSEPTNKRQNTTTKYNPPKIITIEDNINVMRKKLKKENKERMRVLQESLRNTNVPSDLEGVIGSFVES